MSTLATHPESRITSPQRSAIVADYEHVINSEGPSKVVLIDLFDTIIGRRVEPEYVKAIWAKRLRYAAGLNATAETLHGLRVQVEADLCRENQNSGYDDEFRYLDMCNQMFARLDTTEGLASRMTAADFSEICESVEWCVEVEVQFVYPSVKAFLEKLNCEGIPVYVVSDSFFSTRQMRRLLRHHGLEQLLVGFFLSSDTLVAKRSGRLFDRVLQTLKINGSDAIMVGDNPISDVINSRKYGIRPILVQHNIASEARAGHQDSRARFENGFTRIKEIGTNIFPEMTLSLYAFTARLFQRAIQLGVKDLLFCSREGLLLKDLFDRYQSQLGFEGRIRSHYFYTSRLASFLPSLGPLQDETFERLFRQYRTLSLRTFLLSLQFSDDTIERCALSLGICGNEIFQDFPTSSTFLKLRKLPEFTEEYERARQEQRKNTLDYIKSFYPQGKLPNTLALVDVGWKGTIQDNLRRVVDDQIAIHGLYVGLVAPGSASGTNVKEGLLFSVLPAKTRYFDAFFESCAIFEILLSAQHGGTLRYLRHGERIVPELGKDEKTPAVRGLIESMQEAYRHGCEALFDEWRLNHLDELDDLKDVASQHARMVFYPSNQELGMIASLDHYENFGVFNHTTFWLPESLSRTQCIRNFSRFLKNPNSVLGSSLWPALSLARHGLGWIQPWYGKKKMKRIFGYGSR